MWLGPSLRICPSQRRLVLRRRRTRFSDVVAGLASCWTVFPVKLDSILLFAPFMRFMTLFVNLQDSLPNAISEHTDAEYNRSLMSMARCGELNMWRSELHLLSAIAIRASMSWLVLPSAVKVDPRYLKQNTLSRGVFTHSTTGREPCCSFNLATFTFSSTSLPVKFCDLGSLWALLLCILIPLFEAQGRSQMSHRWGHDCTYLYCLIS